MKKLHVCFWAYLAALLMLAAVPADAADVKELFAIDLADSPGKEGRMIEVSYPPGAQDMVHRHDAHAFVYVLEGQIVMQLKGPTCRHAQGRADVLRGSYRCARRGAQRQHHGAGQVRRGAAEGQGGSHPHAGARPMMLGTVRPRARRGTVGGTKPGGSR